MQEKAQSAVELLIILAVSIAVLIAVYGYSGTSMVELNKQKLLDEAQTSVNTLASSANDVYRQGIGATKRAFYTVPSGIDEGKSGIEGNSFVLNVLESDVYAKAETCLLGELPTGRGGHWVWLTAQEQCVFVGEEKLAVDKTSSYVTMLQSDTENDTVTVTNNGSETATVFLTKDWEHSDVSLVFSDDSFSLNAGSVKAVTLTYTSTTAEPGNYTGIVAVSGAFAGSPDENFALPANAEVIMEETDLLLFPPTVSASMREDDSITRDLNVCNNSGTDLTNITFARSGDIATWVSAIDDVAILRIGTCVVLSFTVTVPSGQAFGIYDGTITGTDDLGNTDSTEITITVPEMADDFSFGWSTAYFAAGGARLWEWTITNTGTDAISIDKMAVTWLYDTDGAVLQDIRLNNDAVWSAGGAASGQELNITNFSIPAGTSYSANNRLLFSRVVNNESEDFQITFTFTDSTTYTTTVHSP